MCLLFRVHGIHTGTYFARCKKKVIISYIQNKKHAKLSLCKHDDLTPSFCEWALLTGSQTISKLANQSSAMPGSETGHRHKKCQFSEPDNKTFKKKRCSQSDSQVHHRWRRGQGGGSRTGSAGDGREAGVCGHRAHSLNLTFQT